MVFGLNSVTRIFCRRRVATGSVRPEEDGIVHRKHPNICWEGESRMLFMEYKATLALFGLDVGIAYRMKHNLVLALGQCSLMSLKHGKKRSLMSKLRQDTDDSCNYQ